MSGKDEDVGTIEVTDDIDVTDLGEVDLGQVVAVESDRVPYTPGDVGTMDEETQEKFIVLCTEMLEKGRACAQGYLVARQKREQGKDLSDQDNLLLNNDQLRLKTDSGRPVMIKLRQGPGGLGKSSVVTTGVNLAVVSEDDDDDEAKVSRPLGFIISVGTPQPVRPIVANTARQTWPKSALTSQMHDAAVKAIQSLSAAGIRTDEYTDL